MAQATDQRALTYAQAVNEALRQTMASDNKVFVMGEDIAGGAGREDQGKSDAWGGPFRLTKGLIGDFGPDRVRDTPISEAGFLGAGVGAAATGMRPVVDLMFSGFFGVCADQIVNNAAKMRYMFGGQATLPVVYRALMMYGGGAAAHHSDRSYPMFMNMPGIKIVVPSNPADVKGLLKTAIRDDDPVIFFEDGTISGMRGEVPDEEYLTPFGEANIVKEGNDCTIVAIGGAVNHAISAAESLTKDGISVEVIDPRTLVPLDKSSILNSVEKTGRLVVVDPAHKVCSAASEIASIVAEEGFWSLQAPIQKVASEQVHIPFTPVLEKLVYPDATKISNAVKKTLED